MTRMDAATRTDERRIGHPLLSRAVMSIVTSSAQIELHDRPEAPVDVGHELGVVRDTRAQVHLLLPGRAGGDVEHDPGLAGMAREHLAEGTERGHDPVLGRSAEPNVEHLAGGRRDLGRRRGDLPRHLRACLLGPRRLIAAVGRQAIERGRAGQVADAARAAPAGAQSVQRPCRPVPEPRPLNPAAPRRPACP